jgi:hypothetical protein
MIEPSRIELEARGTICPTALARTVAARLGLSIEATTTLVLRVEAARRTRLVAQAAEAARDAAEWYAARMEARTAVYRPRRLRKASTVRRVAARDRASLPSPSVAQCDRSPFDPSRLDTVAGCTVRPVAAHVATAEGIAANKARRATDAARVASEAAEAARVATAEAATQRRRAKRDARRAARDARRVADDVQAARDALATAYRDAAEADRRSVRMVARRAAIIAAQ